MLPAVPGLKRWRSPRTRGGGVMGVIAVVAYSTGWGPILSLGFIFGAATCPTRRAGHLGGHRPEPHPRAARPRPRRAGPVRRVAHHHAPGPLGGHRERPGRAAPFRGRFAALCATSRTSSWWSAPRGGSLREPRLRAHPGNLPDQWERRWPSTCCAPTTSPACRARRGHGRRRASSGWRTEVRMQHADGTWLWFEATVTNRLEDPNVRGIVANLHDISDRKKAEEVRAPPSARTVPLCLRERSHRHGHVDLEGRIVRANPAMAARIVGRSADDLSGMKSRPRAHPSRRSRDASTAEMRRLVADGSERVPDREALPPRRRRRGLGVGERVVRARRRRQAELSDRPGGGRHRAPRPA